MNITDEQQAVVACEAKTIIVNAFAGTGKTTTLISYARARPHVRMLYLAFNAAMAKEAQARFPVNVDCKTTHSLAFAKVGYAYKEKLGNVRALDVSEFLTGKMSSSHLGSNAFAFSQSVIRRINLFCASPGMVADPRDDFGSLEARVEVDGTRDGPRIALASSLVWKSMCSTLPGSLLMSHDGYLKLFQLSKPDLSRYGVIMLDEAQDTNPCVLGIVESQSSTKLVVGDRHQNIYSFRGAVNAMGHFKGESLSLTKSFRFDQVIADRANILLGEFASETKWITGCGLDRSDETRAFLSRTNAGLFGQAVTLLNNRERLSFVGGIRNYGFSTIVDCWNLKARNGVAIKDFFVRRFKSFSQLEDYAEQIKDKEVLARLSVVEKFGSAIPDLVERLDREVCEPSRATAFLSTAHKAKGLEWGAVSLNSDFPELMCDGVPLTPAHCVAGGENTPLTPDEINLIYVALTRGKHTVTPFAAFTEFEFFAKNALHKNNMLEPA